MYVLIYTEKSYPFYNHEEEEEEERGHPYPRRFTPRNLRPASPRSRRGYLNVRSSGRLAPVRRKGDQIRPPASHHRAVWRHYYYLVVYHAPRIKLGTARSYQYYTAQLLESSWQTLQRLVHLRTPRQLPDIVGITTVMSPPARRQECHRGGEGGTQT